MLAVVSITDAPRYPNMLQIAEHVRNSRDNNGFSPRKVSVLAGGKVAIDKSAQFCWDPNRLRSLPVLLDFQSAILNPPTYSRWLFSSWNTGRWIRIIKLAGSVGSPI